MTSAAWARGDVAQLRRLPLEDADCGSEVARAFKKRGIASKVGTKVTSAKVLKGAGHGFDEAALQGAKQIRFKPATVDGEAVSTEITYTMTFLLD